MLFMYIIRKRNLLLQIANLDETKDKCFLSEPK